MKNHTREGKDRKEGSAHVEGASARMREGVKTSKYVRVYEAVKQGTQEFVPLILENSGYFGGKAKAFVKWVAIIASTGGIENEAAFTTRMVRSITMALHRGNGRIWAAHQLRLETVKILREASRNGDWRADDEKDPDTPSESESSDDESGLDAE